MPLWAALTLAWITAAIGIAVGGTCKSSELADAREEARMEFAHENGRLLRERDEAEAELNRVKAERLPKDNAKA